ncbi:MAG: hypothetical protein U9Q97_03740 [Acidobacteriota bacterium]|nr:hypothetical protein [Acidobacteriota bacterium]
MNVMTLYVLFLFPLGMYGIYHVLKIIKGIYKVKKGCYRLKMIYANGRIRTFWAKPVNEIFNLKDEKLPFKDEPNGVFYEGRTPVVWYVGNQQVFRTTKYHEIDPKHLSSLFMRTYNLGKSQSEKNTKLMFLAIIGCLAVSVITLLLLFGLSKNFDAKFGALTGLINTIKIASASV